MFVNPITRIAILIAVTVVLILALEGLASLLVVADLAVEQSRTLAERIHVRHDPELGWVNIPDLVIPDMYGPGISLRTNAQGFRNDRPFTRAVLPGRLRLICSGDSFTLGYGVSNDDAWCNALAALDPGIEPVNMGQGGYGLDQAWLWYMRDGARLDHDVHVLAFINDDFSRMRGETFLGYAKPTLAVEGGRLVVRHVPVPPQSALSVRLRSMGRTASDFRLAQLFRRVLRGPAAPAASIWAMPSGGPGDAVRPVAEKLFESLRDWHDARGSVLVLVYLPGEEEYGGGVPHPWRTFAHEAAARHGLALIDLVPALDAVARAEAETFFFKVGELPYPGSEGHYTVRGNRFIAAALYQRLLEISSVAAKLRKLPRAP